MLLNYKFKWIDANGQAEGFFRRKGWKMSIPGKGIRISPTKNNRLITNPIFRTFHGNGIEKKRRANVVTVPHFTSVNCDLSCQQ